MAQEFPVVPNGGNDEKIFPFPEQQDDGKAEKAKDGIRRLSEARLSADAPLARLKGYIEVLKSRIRAVIDSEKLIRVERARLSIKLNELKKRHLELQRLRLKKNSEHLEISGKIRALKNGSDAQNGDELSRLESRLKELEDDLSAFSETLTMHRRDRDRVFEKLAESNQRLQDELTESLLGKIIFIGTSPEEKRGRSGMPGVVAEMLGRLLVLEKEEAHLGEIIKNEYPTESS